MGAAPCVLWHWLMALTSLSFVSLSLSPVVQEKSPRRPACALSLSLSLYAAATGKKKRRTHWGEILNKRTATNIYKHVDIYTHVDVYTHSLFFPSLFLSAVRFSYLADFFRLPDSAPLFFLFQLLSHVCKIELWRRISQTKKHITSQTDKKENFFFFSVENSPFPLYFVGYSFW